MQSPLISTKAHERTVAQIKEQYGISLSDLQKENTAFKSEYGKAINEFKAQLTNYIASQVNYAQFQFQDYTLARIVTELYLKDAVVASCVGSYQMHYPEPTQLYFDGKREVPNAPFAKLLQKPNPWMSGTDLDRYTITYQLWTGNAYHLKIYADNGRDIEQLFPFSGLNIYPVPSYDQFVEHYNFVTAEGIVSRLEAQNVIHYPWVAVDPRRLFMGISPMQLCARDIQINILMTEHVANYAKNVTIPGLYATKTGTDAKDAIDGESLGLSTAEDIKKNIKERFSGDALGDFMVGQPGWDWKFLGFPLKDLDIENVVGVHQANICSNFKVDPELLKVSIGLRESTYNNQQTAKLNFFQGALCALWNQNSDKMSSGLRLNYGDGVTIKYDTDSVRTLQEEKQKRLAPYLASIAQIQKDYFSGAIEDQKAAIALVTGFTGLADPIVEPMFPPRTISKLQVTPEGVTTNAQ